VNSLINISEGTSLAIHGLGLLCERAPNRLSVKAMAQALNASEAHLAKVFGKLQKRGWISSMRGPYGGFALTTSADDISFLDVYELFEATVEVDNCPLGRKYCPFSGCMFDGRINTLNQAIYKVLRDTSISDLSPSSKGLEIE
jgi:Rrf2 family protein